MPTNETNTPNDTAPQSANTPQGAPSPQAANTPQSAPVPQAVNTPQGAPIPPVNTYNQQMPPKPPMPPRKSFIPALLIGLAIIIATGIFTFGLVRIKQGFDNSISATGSASTDFESDLIVWRGSFTRFGQTSKAAYARLEKDQEAVRRYLDEMGISDEDFAFSSVNIYQSYRDNYDGNGNYIGRVFEGYNLSQDVTVTSMDIDTVEAVSRDISTLLASGIEFTSENPEYYCTTLDKVKLDLIRKATENARERIEIIAEETGASLGKLQSSNLGVFQITARNSGTSDYSYDGYFDTGSRYKTATITVNLHYALR